VGSAARRSEEDLATRLVAELFAHVVDEADALKYLRPVRFTRKRHPETKAFAIL